MIGEAVSERQDRLYLPGLDGANPLGFLAALGLLRVLDTALATAQSRLRWSPSAGTWIPVIEGSGLDAESLLDFLESTLVDEIANHPVHVLDQLGSEEPTERRTRFQRVRINSSSNERIAADWLAALASDAVPPSAVNQLQTARRDYYYGNLQSVISRTTRSHLKRALFHPWDYADPLDNQSLHWDPSEDRRHAHQWNKPAGDPDRKNSGGMLAANRLAIEAIIWFTSLPAGDALRSVGFTGLRSRNTRWTWPIWNVPLTAQVVQSVLTLDKLQHEEIPADARNELFQCGIVVAFRSRRILVGKTPNFTPAQRIA